MERHTVVLRTLCFVFNDINQVLLMERSADKFDAGMFNVLGGHIEKGEDVLKCAEREVFEESGIKPDSTNLMGIVHVSDFFGKNVMMFVTLSMTKKLEVKESDEGHLTWVDLDKINEYRIYEDVKPFMERIIKDSSMFIGTSKFDGKGNLLELNIRDL